MRILPEVHSRTTPELMLTLRRLFIFSAALYLFNIPLLDTVGMAADLRPVIELGIYMLLYAVICLSFFRVWRELSRRLTADGAKTQDRLCAGMV